LLFAPVLLFGLSLSAALPVLLRLFRKCRESEVTAEWLESFSPAAYYPMQALLSTEDFVFLSRQPGFDLSLYRKLRRERLHIFRGYLRRAILDFNRLHLVARIAIAKAPQDRSDLLGKLIWLKLKFSLAVLHAQASYLFCCLGFRFLAARAVILHLEEMTAQLNLLGSQQLA
jgi:hypothetical protein